MPAGGTPRRSSATRWLTAALAATATAAMAAGPATPGPDEATVRAGQRLFHSAVAADGSELQGALFGGESRLAGQAAACAGCHGSDGQGRIDAGLPVPDIRWEALTRERKPLSGGTARPAYDELSLLRALRSGVDPAGRRLAAAMPRFEITPRQAAELVGYLQRLGTENDQAPGVTTSELRMAIVVRSEQEATAHVAAAAACLREANAQGGVYGRRLTWTVRRASELRDEEAWRQLGNEVALVLAPAWSSQEQLDRFSRWAGREQLLVIGPAGVPLGDAGSTGTTFRVAADPSAAWQAVLEHLAARPGTDSRATVLWAVRPEGPEATPEWRALRSHAARQEGVLWNEAPASALSAGAAAGWPPPDAVLVTGGAAQVAEIDSVLGSRGVPASVPIVATSAALGPGAARLPQSARDRLLLVHTHPLADDLQLQRLLQALREEGARLVAPALQTTAFAAGCLAVEGLRRTGRRVTHAGLREALESVRDYSTGVTMPLTYGARQRQGVWGARLVRLQGEHVVAATPWLTPGGNAR